MNMVTVSPVPTQIRHPWRATFRTILAFVIGVAPLVPTIAASAGLDRYQWAAVAVGIAAAITRVMAIPGVNKWLGPLSAAPSVTSDTGGGNI